MGEGTESLADLIRRPVTVFVGNIAAALAVNDHERVDHGRVYRIEQLARFYYREAGLSRRKQILPHGTTTGLNLAQHPS